MGGLTLHDRLLLAGAIGAVVLVLLVMGVFNPFNLDKPFNATPAQQQHRLVQEGLSNQAGGDVERLFQKVSDYST